MKLTDREYMAQQRMLTSEIKTYESAIRCLQDKIDRALREKNEMARDYAAQRVTARLTGEVQHVA